MGQEIRDRFSGAVEAFARRNNSGSGIPGDQSKHRVDDIASSSVDAVSTFNIFFFFHRYVCMTLQST